jgi:hypothetical protein
MGHQTARICDEATSMTTTRASGVAYQVIKFGQAQVTTIHGACQPGDADYLSAVI